MLAALTTRRKSASVLVVEDDTAAREMYRQALIGAGYRVVSVPDGLDALKQIEAHRPGAVVLDLLLPRVSGLDVYKELRTKYETHTIPVVIVTGSDNRELDSGEFRFFLRKPIDPDALVQTVERALKRRRPATRSRTTPGAGSGS